MKNYLTVLLIGLSSIALANAQTDLNNWLDSTYNANDISEDKARTEFLVYTKENYKKTDNVSNFLPQFKPKKRTKGPKEFNLNNKLTYLTLKDIAHVGANHFGALEKELYRIIITHNLQKDQNAFTYLWIYINHLNNLPLNDTRPNDMAYELFELKRYMIAEEALFERIALIILARKIFLENNYINSEALVNKTFPKTKVVYLGKGEDDQDDEDAPTVDVEEPIADFAEVEPSFIGGMDNMISFIVLNINYPQKSREMGDQGNVYVKFIVDKDGSITDVAIRRGRTKLLDREAARVIQLMPKWIPGEQLNEPVRVNFTIPISFRLG
jgi:TonB family protein